MGNEDFSGMEKKWQKRWEEKKVFSVKEGKGRKFYNLEMFPYPSGSGLHMGHAFNYTIGDIYARFKRMQGYSVLYPMGYDAFGLPAENAAIKAKEHPAKFTNKAIENFIKQQKSLGLSYDWSRIIRTCDPEYYKWNQYFFLKFLENGLVYRKKASVNWCPKCDTVLANEQVHNGKCWRHTDTEVQIKFLEQWFIKTTKYADELLEDIPKLKWPERIKLMQENWIGKSYGTEIDFEMQNPSIKTNFILLHGYTGNPNDNFFPWLKSELEKRGYSVDVPNLPNTNNPDIDEQVKYVLKNCKFNSNTILLGHSLGSVVALKVVESLNKPIKKLITAAGFAQSKFKDKERPFEKKFNWKFDFNKIKNNVQDVILLRAENDSAVPAERSDYIKEKIGGTIIDFKAEDDHICADKEPIVLDNCLDKWPIFTTRPDTIYGVTFMVVSAQHPRLMELVTEKQKAEVEKFLKKIKSTSEKDIEELEKEGAFTGSYAINPLTNDKVPVYTGNFVVADYGSGMVMAVPAHDQRDFEFARKYNIPVKWVIKPENAEYTIIEKSLPKDKIDKLKDYGIVKVIKEDKDWGKFYKVSIKVDTEKRFIEFLENNLLKTSEDGGAWYADSVGTTNFVVFPNKHFTLNNKQDIQDYTKYGLSIGIPKEQLDVELRSFTSEGKLVNSEEFNGIKSVDAINEITKYLEKKKLGKKVVQYKLRDWLVSRQRYWGTPIPIIYCDKCGIVPVSEKDLPIELPEKVEFGKGNPLATNKKFIEVKCPKCKGKARRETDTMDTFFDSSWYFLRYCDSKNSKKPFDSDKIKYWMPVDQYIGGAEHACMHLIYARFFTKALRDMGYLKFDEPFTNLFNQGMLHGNDGFVMSKSRGNVVLPEEVSEKYGIDTARLFLMSIASPDKDTQWNDKGVEGSLRFVNRVMEIISKIKKVKSSARIESKVNKSIKEITEDIENFRYNIAIIKLRTLFEVIESESEISKKDIESFIKLLSPFAPHIAEELWEKIGNKGFVSLESWPKVDEKKIDVKLEQQEQAVDKTVSDIVNIINIIKEKQGKEADKVYLYVIPNELTNYNSEMLGKRLNKTVKVFAVNDKSKYDPENKAGKAKPGRPGVFVE